MDDAGGVALGTWTYDYSKYKDKTSGSTFLLVVQGAGRVTISGPITFQELFDASVKDASGHPAANREVILHAARGEDVKTASDPNGRVKTLVPPGVYIVELGGPLPADQQIPAFDDDGSPTAAAADAAQGDGDGAPDAAADDAAADDDLGNHPAKSIPGAVFAFDMAFPGPGIFAHLQQIEDAANAHAAARLVVFGHADPKGTEAYNKDLTDRRAKAVLALLTDDLAMFETVSQHDKWDVAEYQAMLRGLGCNAGAIDGLPGPILQDAVTSFQEEYNDNVYHQGQRPRAHGDLSVNGTLDDATKAAIRDAYVCGTPGSIDAGRFYGPKFAGCSKFNLIGNVDALDRRVVVALFGPDGPKETDFPCKEGNVKACTVDAQTPMRCTFYRQVVAEEDRGDYPHFFDFEWLKRKDGRVELSALTTLPDKSAATFKVYKCENGLLAPPPASWKHDKRPDPGTLLGTIDGKIRNGVAFAVWDPPQDYDAFDYSKWLVDHTDDEIALQVWQDHSEPPASSPNSAQGTLALKAMQPPVFSVESGDQWAFSQPPGKKIGKIKFRNGASAVGSGLSADGGYITFQVTNERVATAKDLRVISVAIVSQSVKPDDDSGGAQASSGSANG
ncbi:MAG TPA: OmpA family protein [Planctomycetota bacterium]|nr:OmpA family protein [Planctomycetota bacterium]